MRRSKSTSRISGIPLPASLQNKIGDPRSKVGSRLSRQRSFEGLSVYQHPNRQCSTPLSHLPGPSQGSAGRKPSTQSNNFLTPVYGSGFKNSRSLSSFGSRVGSARGKSPSQGKNTIRPNDKKWLEEEFSKIKEFIQTSGLFNPDLAKKIRPPSMAIFVELVGVLIERLMKTIPINSQNCAEEVMRCLKVLGYPGQVTSSTLKTVYTSHGWPQFVSIVGWLIDRADLGYVEEKFRLQLDQSDQMAYNLHDAMTEYLSMKYNPSTATDDPEVLKCQDDRFHDALVQISGIDCEECERVGEILQTERAQFDKIDSAVREIEDENAQIQAKTAEWTAVVEKYKDGGFNKEHEVKEELEKLNADLLKQTARKEELVTCIEKLQRTVDEQQFTVNDRDKLMRQIEDQQRLVERKQQQLNEYQEVRGNLDLQLRNRVVQIEKHVDKWNVSIKKTFLPEFQQFHLREKGFFRDNFLKEINDVRTGASALQNNLLAEYQTSQDELAKLLSEKQSLTERGILIEADRLKLNQEKTKIASMREHNKDVALQLEEAVKAHELRMKQMEEAENAKIKVQTGAISDIQLKIQEHTKEIEKNSKCYLAMMAELHDDIVTDMRRYDAEKRRMYDEAQAALEESSQHTVELFKHLKRLREFNALLANE